jgi:5'/3'-nucleotidase SurE
MKHSRDFRFVQRSAGGPVLRKLAAFGASVILLVGAVATQADAGQPPATCVVQPLNILLTNDDGYDTPGIEALHRALVAAGHRVKRIAPAENHSGGGTGLSLRPVSVATVPSDEFADVFAVDGTPATTVLLGATAMFSAAAPVDLVVSGINEGANLGPATTVSGTVGATIVGLRVLEPAVPGIALSTNPVNEDLRSPENLELNRRVAAFAVRLVAAQQQAHCGVHKVMPPELVLNVNYPPLAADEIQGARWARQSRTRTFGLAFTAAEDDLYVPAFKRVEWVAGDPEGDTELFAAGFITVVPLDGDYSIPAEGLPALDGLAP